MSDTPRTEAEVNRQKCCSDDLITIDANFACQLERELNAANDRIKRLEEDLSDAYAEMRKQYPVIKAVFDSSVWTKAKEAKP